MPEFLSSRLPEGAADPAAVIVYKILTSGLIGFVIALVHRFGTRHTVIDAVPFFIMVVMLPMLVTITTVVIADSMARAFGLVGALSIVRFRTRIEDVRDTAFIVFAVGAGMAVGSADFVVYAVGVPLVCLVALGLHFWGRARQGPYGDRRLEVRVGIGLNVDGLVGGAFSRHLSAFRLTGAATARMGCATDFFYVVKLRKSDGITDLIDELSRIEGVQGVELRAP